MPEGGTHFPPCEHVNVSRRPGIYYDGRPVYLCADCGARLVDENTDPSHKALAPLRGTS